MKKIILITMVLIPVILLSQSWNVEIRVRGQVALTEDLQQLNTDVQSAINNNLVDATYDYEINIVQDSTSYYDIYLEIEGLRDSVDTFGTAVDNFFESKFDRSYIRLECWKKYNNDNR